MTHTRLRRASVVAVRQQWSRKCGRHRSKVDGSRGEQQAVPRQITRRSKPKAHPIGKAETIWAQQLIVPSRFAMVEVPALAADQLRQGQVLLHMRAGAICGSDMPLFRGSVPEHLKLLSGSGDSCDVRHQPLPPGLPIHEVVGDVVTSRSDLRAGQRVVGSVQSNDGLAEQIIAEQHSLMPVDSSANPAYQVVIHPLTCEFHALDRIRPIKGRRAAVVGQGPIGLLLSEILHVLGANHVVGVDIVRRATGGYAFGTDETANLASDRWAHTLSELDRPETVIEGVGHQGATTNHAIAATANEATIFCLGNVDERSLAIDMLHVQPKGLCIISGTTRTAYRRPALTRGRDYLTANTPFTKPYVTNVFSASDAQDAYESAGHPHGQTHQDHAHLAMSAATSANPGADGEPAGWAWDRLTIVRSAAFVRLRGSSCGRVRLPCFLTIRPADGGHKNHFSSAIVSYHACGIWLSALAVDYGRRPPIPRRQTSR